MDLHVDPSYRRPAPSGGAAAAAAAGRARRRQRRAAGGGAAAVAVLGLAVAVASSGGGTQSLVQVPAGTPTASPAPSLAEPVATTAPGSGARPAATPSVTPTAVPVLGPQPTPRPSASHGPAQTGPKRPWHRPVVREQSGYNVGSVCQGSASQDDPSDHGWCLSSLEVGEASTSAPTTVGLELCRQTSGVTEGSLDFADAQELEVVVSDGPRQLWRWSAGVTVPKRPHTVTIANGVCLRWRTTWNATTSDGRPLGNGDYTVVSRLVTPGNGGLTTSTGVTVSQ